MVWKENYLNTYCEITPAIMALKEQWEKKNYIDPQLYKDYNVKRGLRDENNRGVLTGLTRVAEIQSYDVVETPEIIAPGMAFCVDVGIYHEEWGIGFRLEDNCLVTEDGCENLSAAIPRTVEDIEAVMRKK